MDGSDARRKRFVARFDFLPLKSNALTSKWVRGRADIISVPRKGKGREMGARSYCVGLKNEAAVWRAGRKAGRQPPLESWCSFGQMTLLCPFCYLCKGHGENVQPKGWAQPDLSRCQSPVCIQSSPRCPCPLPLQWWFCAEIGKEQAGIGRCAI